MKKYHNPFGQVLHTPSPLKHGFMSGGDSVEDCSGTQWILHALFCRSKVDCRSRRRADSGAGGGCSRSGGRAGLEPPGPPCHLPAREPGPSCQACQGHSGPASQGRSCFKDTS